MNVFTLNVYEKEYSKQLDNLTNELNNEITEYNYVFLNFNTHIFEITDDKLTLIESNFIKNEKLDQLILIKCEDEYNLSEQYDYDNKERIYDKIKSVLSDKTNPYRTTQTKPTYKDLNWVDISMKKFKTNLNFRFKPSYIKMSSIKKNKKSVLDFLSKVDESYSKHNEHVVAMELDKNMFLTEYIDLGYMTNDKIMRDKKLINHETCDTTIITGYIDVGIKRPPKKNIQEYDYLKKSKDTLSLNQNMIIFLSEKLIPQIKKHREDIGLSEKTYIIPIDMNDLYMKDRIEDIIANTSKNISPYNIPQYIMAVNSRYGFMERAIHLNPFKTNYFAWVDFAAGHIVDIPTNYMINYNKKHLVRIAWIARLRKCKFVFNHEALGGGVFTAHKDAMLEYCRLHDIEFKKMMSLGHNINDDKLCFLIFEKYPHLFDVYFSGYSNLMTKLCV